MKEFNRIVSAGLVGLLVAGSHSFSHAQNPEASPLNSVKDDSGSVGKVVINVISVGTVYVASRYTKDQVMAAAARSKFHSRTLVDSAGGTLQPTLATKILEGTVPGDVIQLKYVAGTKAALQNAVLDLEHSQHVWQKRVMDLQVERSGLSIEIEELRKASVQFGADEFATRNSIQRRALELGEDLVSLDKVLADADKRMHAAASQYQSARKNLEFAQASPNAKVRVSVVRDVLVDTRADFTLRSFIAQNIRAGSATAVKQAIPHIQIVRVQGANSKLVAGSVARFKGGLLGMGVGLAVFVEEMFVGEISDSLDEMAATHFAPRARTSSDRPIDDQSTELIHALIQTN